MSASVPPTDRSAIAAAIELEMALGSAGGSSPDIDELCARYPEHQDLVRDAVARYGSGVGESNGSDSGSVAEFDVEYERDRARGQVRELAEYVADAGPSAVRVAARFANLEADRADNQVDPPHLEPGTQLDRYRIEAPLGRGGQGSVFRARDIELGRAVAIKVIPGGRGSAALARFQREARAGSRLDHPALCTVHDAGSDEGFAFLVTEFIDGEPLSAVIARARAADDAQSGSASGTNVVPGPGAHVAAMLSFFEEVADALHTAHESGVVHRDLKPGNLMVTTAGRPVVLDFGVARDSESQELTRTGDIVGTPAYMAPEQLTLDARDLDRRIDVYALGVVLYECLTLRRPFVGAGIMALRESILRDTVIDPRRLRRGLSNDLAVVVLTALERSRERRYATAAELAADLRAVRLGQSIAARPPGPWLRLVRWRRRHPVLAASLALVALALGVVLWLQESAVERVTEARDEALAINDFLVEELLLSMTPQEARGGEVRAADVLDRAGASVAEEFPNETAVAAAVRHVLARTNARLERFDEALRWYEEAERIRARVLGEEHPSAIDSRVGVASTLRQMGRYKDADATLRPWAAKASAQLGADHPSAIGVHFELAQIERARGKYREALGRLEDVAARRARLVGRDDPATMIVDAMTARVLTNLEKFDEAEELMREVFARRERVLDEDDTGVHDSRIDLASLLQDRGKFDEALQLHEQCVAYAARVFGTESIRYAFALNNAASLLQRLGMDRGNEGLLDRAESMSRESLDIRRENYGEMSEAVANARNNLATLLFKRKRFEEGVAEVGRAVEIREKVLGPGHRRTITSRFNWLALRFKAGERDVVEPLAELVRDTREPLGEHSVSWINMLSFHGGCLLEVGRVVDAEVALRDAFERLGKIQGTASLRGRVGRKLASAYDKLDRAADAEAVRAAIADG